MTGRLAIILLLCAAVRLAALLSLPKGLESDEASNVWNAWCLLHTGHDEWGQHFPVIAERAFDDYRTTTYLYALIPFQLIGGMNEFTARLPALLGNVATAALLFYIAKRMFGPAVASTATVLFAVMPWNILVGRLAHEATLMPLEFAASLALLIRAGLPILDRPAAVNWRIGLLAGATLGISMYGYAALRIALPITLAAIVLLNAVSWFKLLRTRDGWRLISAIALPAILLATPLAYEHLYDPNLNIRAHENGVWNHASTFAGHASLLLTRYAWHFGPEFLFARSTPNPIIAGPQGCAGLQWYWLPLLMLGIGMILFRSCGARIADSISDRNEYATHAPQLQGASARTLLAITLCFPLVDLLFGMTEQAHPFYSSLGMLALPMLAGVGWVGLLNFSGTSRRAVGATGLAIATISAIVFMTRLAHDDRSPLVTFAKNTDLTEAAAYVRSRLDSVDTVYVTQEHLVYPYAPLLAAMNYNPGRWFAEPRDYAFARPPFQAHHTCVHFGKIWLFDDPAALHLNKLHPGSRVLMVLRPDQAQLARGHSPAKVISVSPASILLIYEFGV